MIFKISAAFGDVFCKPDEVTFRVISRMQTQTPTWSKQTDKVLSIFRTGIFALISGNSFFSSRLSFNKIILLCVPHTLCPNLHLKAQQRGTMQGGGGQ